MTARTGEYSDFRLDAIFERREDADACVARGAGEDVYEYDLFGPGDDSYHRRPLFTARAIVSPDGHIHDSHSWSFQQNGLQVETAVRASRGWDGSWQVSSEAATPEAATKAVRERAAKVASLLAQGMDPAEMEER